MDKADIRAFLRWQANAARRAKQAGFDIVYCYAGHGYLPFQFISPRWNRRSDEYGGAIANRARLLRDTSLSRDLLEERARSLLGLSDPRDYVIRSQKPTRAG